MSTLAIRSDRIKLSKFNPYNLGLGLGLGLKGLFLKPIKPNKGYNDVTCIPYGLYGSATKMIRKRFK